MAWQRQVGAFNHAAPSATDLTGMEYRFAVIDGNGAIALSGLGGEAQGVIQEGKPVGRNSSIATGGQLKVLASAAINEGDEIASAANGLARVAGAGHEILGVALTSVANANELVTVNFNPKGLHV